MVQVVYAGNLPRDCRRSELEDFLSKFPPDDISLKEGYAFLTYDDKRDAEDVIEDLDGTRFAGRRILLEKKRGGRADSFERRRSPPPRRRFGRSRYAVVVEDIPRECSWQDLKDFAREFRRCPRPVTTEVLRRDGSPVGLLEFNSSRDVEDAIDALDKQKIRPGRGAPHNYKPTTVRVFADNSRSPPRRSLSASRSRSRSRKRSRSRDRSRSRSRSPGPPKDD